MTFKDLHNIKRKLERANKYGPIRPGTVVKSTGKVLFLSANGLKELPTRRLKGKRK